MSPEINEARKLLREKIDWSLLDLESLIEKAYNEGLAAWQARAEREKKDE